MDRAEVEYWRQRLEAKVGAGTPVAAAIEREDWELAAMHMLLGALEIMEEVGPDALDALLDELEPTLTPHRGSRARKQRKARGRRG